jgi:hypothetical protein
VFYKSFARYPAKLGNAQVTVKLQFDTPAVAFEQKMAIYQG